MIIYEPISRKEAIKLDKDMVWFEGRQSTGLWYYKRILIKQTDSPSIIVQAPADSVFYIYDPCKATEDFVDNKKVLIQGAPVQLKSDHGFFNIYIVGHANEPGEFIDSIQIADEKLQVGMEAYGENEVLRINLQNMGVELPDSVARAIYETDLYEEKTDWVTLNSKWKELLTNFMDVIGCKGNYKSLENSLSWFNYGRLVELRECWKHDYEGGVKLMDRPLNRWMSDWYNKSLAGISKTSYLVLRACSVDLSKKIGSQTAPSLESDLEICKVPVYQPYTYDPKRISENDLTETEIKWSKDEMRMKMQLLGMFFESNFMPVYLDLFHSTVEDLYFDIPYGLHLSGGAEIEMFDFSSINDFEIHCNGKDDEPNESGFDCVVHLDQQSVYGVYANFGSQTTQDSILGVTYDPPKTQPADSDIPVIMQNWFNGIGAVVDFDIITKSQIQGGKIITSTGKERTSLLKCNPVKYNVDTLGKILNYDPPVDGAKEWNENLSFYKQIYKTQYAIVNQYGYPSTNARYDQPGNDWILWTPVINWDANETYYIQTNSAKYVRVNALGQQIDDTWYTEIPQNSTEYSLDLHYVRTLYCTNVKLLYTGPGEYWVLLELYDNNDLTYSKKLNFKVVDNVSIGLEFFKLIYNNDGTKNPFEINIKNNPNLGPNKAMFSTTRVPDVQPKLFEKYGWETVNKSASNPMHEVFNHAYKLPSYILDDYTYSQYMKLQIDNIHPGDAPRLSWVGSIYIENDEELKFDITREQLENDGDFWFKFGSNYIMFVGKQSSSTREDVKSKIEYILEHIQNSQNQKIKKNIRAVYIPEFHALEYISPEHPDVQDFYPVVAIPVIEMDINGKRKDFTWSLPLSNPAWRFESFLHRNTQTLKFNIQQPFLLSKYSNEPIEGRYKVSFTYKWGEREKTIERLSPFNIIKT